MEVITQDQEEAISNDEPVEVKSEEDKGENRL